MSKEHPVHLVIVYSHDGDPYGCFFQTLYVEKTGEYLASCASGPHHNARAALYENYKDEYEKRFGDAIHVRFGSDHKTMNKRHALWGLVGSNFTKEETLAFLKGTDEKIQQKYDALVKQAESVRAKND